MLVVTIYKVDDSGKEEVLLVQSFNPETGKPFSSEEEANTWADDMIALMVPSAIEEEVSEESTSEGNL